MTRRITQWVVLVTIVVWIGWDVFVAIEPTPGDTESEVIRDWSWDHPSFPFGVGVVMGHFFWTRRGGRYWEKSWMLLPVVGIVVIGSDVMDLFPRVLPLIPFVVGVVTGHLLWTQGSQPGEIDGEQQTTGDHPDSLSTEGGPNGGTR